MISQKEFYELYNKNSPKNKNRHVGPIDARLFLRDLSLPIAYFLARKKVSTNKITLTFLLISLFSSALFVIPSFYTLLFLIIFLEIAQLLDCVDGQLARYQGVSSKFGDNLDRLAHVLIAGTFIIAFGIRLYLQTDQVMFLILGSIGGFFKAFEHQIEASELPITESPAIRRHCQGSKFRRYIVYGLDTILRETRIFAFFVLVLTLIQLAIPYINLVGLSLVGLVLFSFLESFVYRIHLMLKQVNTVDHRVWKGWSKE